MNNPLQISSFGNHELRIFDIEGKPWLLAKEVCEVLGISKYRDAITRLRDYERESVVVDTLGGPQQMTVISESGVLRLVLTSRKPEAEAFQDWLVLEVIPSIFKTGRYEITGLDQPRQQFTEPVTQGIIRYVDEVGPFKGTPTELHWRLGLLSPQFTHNNIDWPRNIGEFGERLNKIAPYLATQRVELTRLPRTSKGHQLSIRRSGAVILHRPTNELAEFRQIVLEQALEIRRLKSR